MQAESTWIDDLQTLAEAMFGGCGTCRDTDCACLSDAALERRIAEVFGVSGGVHVEARDGWIAVECEAGCEPTWPELEQTALSIPGVRGLTSHRGS